MGKKLLCYRHRDICLSYEENETTIYLMRCWKCKNELIENIANQMIEEVDEKSCWTCCKFVPYISFKPNNGKSQIDNCNFDVIYDEKGCHKEGKEFGCRASLSLIKMDDDTDFNKPCDAWQKNEGYRLGIISN